MLHLIVLLLGMLSPKPEAGGCDCPPNPLCPKAPCCSAAKSHGSAPTPVAAQRNAGVGPDGGG
jgi:hypothetical protein